MTTRVQDRTATQAPAIRPAEVVAVDGDRVYTVRFVDGSSEPTRWASHALADAPVCAPGQRVLVAVGGHDTGYVIGVLDPPTAYDRIRAGTAEARRDGTGDGERLVVQDAARALMVTYDPWAGVVTLSPAAAANLVLAAPDGDIALNAGKRLRLRGDAGTDLATRRLTVSARRTIAVLGEAMVDAEALTATVRRLRQVGERVEVIATHIVERAATVCRRATSLYRQDAKRLRLSAEDSVAVRGNRIDVHAKGDARVDGDRIRLG